MLESFFIDASVFQVGVWEKVKNGNAANQIMSLAAL
jgi:hypothetical protein